MIHITLISFLGPKGTFTHEAANLIGDELVPYCTIPAVFENEISVIFKPPLKK